MIIETVILHSLFLQQVVICISGDCIIPFFVEKKWRGLIIRLFLQKRGICLPVNISSQFYNSPFLQNEIQLSIYVGKSCQWDSSNREAIFCSKNGELLPFGQSIQHKWTIIMCYIRGHNNSPFLLENVIFLTFADKLWQGLCSSLSSIKLKSFPMAI